MQNYHVFGCKGCNKASIYCLQTTYIGVITSITVCIFKVIFNTQRIRIFSMFFMFLENEALICCSNIWLSDSSADFSGRKVGSNV